MKLCSNFKLAISLAVLAMFLCLYAVATEAEDIPDTVLIDHMVELYEPVSLDHAMHADMYGCGACHHHTTGDGAQNDSCAACHANSPAVDDVSCSACHEENSVVARSVAGDKTASVYHIDKPGLRGALHLQCLGCHQREDGPVGCRECHLFTPEGRKRFTLEDSP